MSKRGYNGAGLGSGPGDGVNRRPGPAEPRHILDPPFDSIDRAIVDTELAGGELAGTMASAAEATALCCGMCPTPLQQGVSLAADPATREPASVRYVINECGRGIRSTGRPWLCYGGPVVMARRAMRDFGEQPASQA